MQIPLKKTSYNYVQEAILEAALILALQLEQGLKLSGQHDIYKLLHPDTERIYADLFPLRLLALLKGMAKGGKKVAEPEICIETPVELPKLSLRRLPNHDCGRISMWVSMASWQKKLRHPYPTVRYNLDSLHLMMLLILQLSDRDKMICGKALPAYTPNPCCLSLNQTIVMLLEVLLIQLLSDTEAEEILAFFKWNRTGLEIPDYQNLCLLEHRLKKHFIHTKLEGWHLPKGTKSIKLDTTIRLIFKLISKLQHRTDTHTKTKT